MIGAAATATSSRSDLTAGNQRAKEGIKALNSGDYAAAADLFGDSADAFARADDKLGGVITAPASLIPGLSQNLSAGSDLAAAARDAMATASVALDQIDPSTLRLVDGAIDLDAIRAVEAPLVDVQNSLVMLRAVADGVDSPWLLGRLQDELVQLDEKLDENEPRLTDALSAVRLAPQCSAPTANGVTSCCSPHQPKRGGWPASWATSPRSPSTTGTSTSPDSAAVRNSTPT